MILVRALLRLSLRERIEVRVKAESGILKS
jgi:hypothetical protein